MIKSAVVSSCGNYRYELRRIWDANLPVVLFIGLNPSTADQEVDDNTSRVCINYAKRWGCGGLLLGNLFAYRSTDPSVLKKVGEPVGKDNDSWLKQLQDQSSLVVCAWSADGRFMGRDKQVLAYLRQPHCLTKLKDGSPGHPLYKSASLQPVRF